MMIIEQFPLTLGVDELARILHKKPDTISRDMSRPDRRAKLPTPIPSWKPGDRPLWSTLVVFKFLGIEVPKVVVVVVSPAVNAIVPPETKSIGDSLMELTNVS
jgi:hypothetical protein